MAGYYRYEVGVVDRLCVGRGPGVVVALFCFGGFVCCVGCYILLRDIFVSACWVVGVGFTNSICLGGINSESLLVWFCFWCLSVCGALPWSSCRSLGVSCQCVRLDGWRSSTVLLVEVEV